MLRYSIKEKQYRKYVKMTDIIWDLIMSCPINKNPSCRWAKKNNGPVKSMEEFNSLVQFYKRVTSNFINKEISQDSFIPAPVPELLRSPRRSSHIQVSI